MALLVEIATPCDSRDTGVELWDTGVELWADHDMVASVILRENQLKVIIYPSESGEPWTFGMDELLSGLRIAQENARHIVKNKSGAEEN